MKAVLITSVSDFSGKNLLCVVLGKKLQADGYELGFMKPIGNVPARSGRKLTDEDAVFFKRFLRLKDDIDDMCPVMITDSLVNKAWTSKPDDIARKIRTALKRVSKGKDVVLLKGLGRFYRGSSIGFSELEMIKAFDLPVILIDKLKALHETADELLGARNLLGSRLKGVILNRVPRTRAAFVREKLLPYLKSQKIRLLGIVKEDPVLGAVSVDEIRTALSASFLCCHDRGNELVERLSVGAMSVQAALKHFRAVRDKAVITGGDRADIQLAALETSTKCIVLTGNLYPSGLIISKAEEAGVPLLLTAHDTLAAVDKIDRIMGRISLHSDAKVREAERIVRTELDFAAINQAIGL